MESNQVQYKLHLFNIFMSHSQVHKNKLTNDDACWNKCWLWVNLALRRQRSLRWTDSDDTTIKNMLSVCGGAELQCLWARWVERAGCLSADSAPPPVLSASPDEPRDTAAATARWRVFWRPQVKTNCIQIKFINVDNVDDIVLSVFGSSVETNKKRPD